MKKNKINKINLIKYFLIFIIFLVLTNAKGYSVSPFSVGALFALMWCGLYLPMIASEYLLANIILMNGVADIYSAITTVFILMLVYFIHKRIKKPMNVVLVGVYTLLSQVVSIYYIFNIGGWLDSIIFAVVTIVFLYISIAVFQLFVLRGGIYKLTLDEGVCAVAFICALSFGIAQIYVWGCPIYKFIGVLAVLLCVGCDRRAESVIVGISIGLGVSVVCGQLGCVGEMAIISIVANMFGGLHKYKTSITVLLVGVIIQLYFVGMEYDVVYSILPIAFAVTGYLIFANIGFKKMYSNNLRNSELSTRNVIGCARRKIKRRMDELSDVFAQMKQIHLKMIQQEFTKEQLSSLISKEILNTICADCKNRNNCYRESLSNKSSVEILVDIAIKKGKATILDLPATISQKCGMINILIGKINRLIEEFEDKATLLKDVNQVKFLLAEHTGAVSQLLLNLSQDLDRDISFDTEMQSKIINDLLSKNIICEEVLIFSEKGDNVSVVAIIKGDGAYNPVVEKVVSRAINLPMVVVGVEPTEINGYYSVTLSRACRRDVVFGITSRTKTGSTNSGDSHSLIRLGSNKYLLALCDGMGSGERAREMSALTMVLVESFYKAGFDDGFVLNNINKLLAVKNQENFSTLDLCVLDLDKGAIDFIKLGATYGIIKREHNVERVESGTLPLGVLGEVKPNISRFAINNKDMIVMVTDGITDAFNDYQEFADFVNAIASTNPQVVAQTILDEAVAQYGGVAKDDMTVLVARTFLKR